VGCVGGSRGFGRWVRPFPLQDLAILFACRSAILLEATCVKGIAAGVEPARVKPIGVNT
jgi:hypothetical protein